MFMIYDLWKRTHQLYKLTPHDIFDEVHSLHVRILYLTEYKHLQVQTFRLTW